MIGTNFSVLQTFSGFVCPNFNSIHSATAATSTIFYPAGIEYFSRLNCFISNGRPGHLQFYSHSSDKLLFNVSMMMFFFIFIKINLLEFLSMSLNSIRSTLGITFF